MSKLFYALVLVAGGAVAPGLSAKSTLQIRAETALKERLVDPDSLSIKVDFENDRVICGEWNAKNRMGGYNGFLKFFYTEKDKNAVLMVEDPNLDTSKGLTEEVLHSMLASSLCDELRAGGANE